MSDPALAAETDEMIVKHYGDWIEMRIYAVHTKPQDKEKIWLCEATVLRYRQELLRRLMSYKTAAGNADAINVHMAHIRELLNEKIT